MKRFAMFLLRLYPREYQQDREMDWREIVQWHQDRFTKDHKGRLTLVLFLFMDVIKSLPTAYGNSMRTLPATTTFVRSVHRNFSHALRGLVRRPTFTTAAITSLALGVGVNTAVFSVVNAVLLQPLPYEDPDRLVIVWNEFPAADRGRLPMSGPQLAVLRDEDDIFDDVAGVWGTTATIRSRSGTQAQVSHGVITPNFFDVLGIPLAQGPGFQRTDDVFPTGIMISHEMWRGRFGADSNLVGTTVQLDGEPTIVVGVLPAEFRLFFPEDAAIPSTFDTYVALPWDLTNLPPAQRFLRVVGRLEPDVSLPRAVAGVRAAGDRALAVYPELQPQGDRLTAEPLHADTVRAARPVLYTLLVAVGLFLLLACANVTNLTISRSTARAREFAIRRAIGSSHRDLLQLLLAECAILSVVGAGIGLGVGRLAATLTWAIRPQGLARAELSSLNGTILLFTFVLAIVTMCALAATAFSVTHRASATFGTLTTLGTTTLRSVRTREMLTSTALATSLVLLTGTALMIQSVTQLGKQNIGFEPSDLLTFKVSFPDELTRSTRVQEITRAASSVPGVRSVGATSHPPFVAWANWAGNAAPEGVTEDGQNAYLADLRSITPNYFSAIEATVISGRGFRLQDDATNQPVVIIDSTMWGRAFGLHNAIGKTLRTQRYTAEGFVETSAVVVGVVRDIRDRNPAIPSGGQVFWPYQQSQRWELTFLIRTMDNAAIVASALQQAVRSVDPSLAISDVQPMHRYVQDVTAITRFLALIGGIFSVLAVVLAAVGLYGIIASVTAQQRPEFGIRSVLGATPMQLLLSVVARGVRIGVVGVGLGFIGALGLTGYLKTLVYGINPHDPATFAAASVALVAVAVIASLTPALDAARWDPVTAIRERQ